jgi:Eukaryotic aspartyl protease
VEPEENPQDAFYVPIIDDSGFWKIYSCSVVIDGTAIQRTKNTAIADTGTTLCLVDKATCEAIYAKIPGSKYVPYHSITISENSAL